MFLLSDHKHIIKPFLKGQETDLTYVAVFFIATINTSCHNSFNEKRHHQWFRNMPKWDAKPMLSTLLLALVSSVSM